MTSYFPDNWVVIRIGGDNPHYRVLVGWSGGYAKSDSWRMNSGIISVETADNSYTFWGQTGSRYVCGKCSYGLRRNNAYIWTQLQEQYGDAIELMPEDTDWTKIDWGIK